MASELEVHFIGERVSSGAVGAVALNLYQGTPTSDDMRRLAAQQRELHRRIGRPIGVLSLTGEGLSLPDAQARRTASELRDELQGVVAAASTVIPGSGFWVASAISLINTIALVSRASSPTKTFGDRREAIDWLLSHVDGDAASIAAGLRQLEREA